MKGWMVWCPDRGETEDGAAKIEASPADCAEEAATEWAERDDRESAEYAIVGGENVVVHVKDPYTGEVSSFEVYGEPVPYYYATPIGSDLDEEFGDPGHCPICKKQWQHVRPGKSQPDCSCQEGER